MVKKIIFIIIIILFTIFLYAKYVSPTNLTVKEYSIHNEKIPEGFNGTKIVHFSDLLYKNENDIEFLQKVIDKINEEKPDIIIFTGDLLSNKITSKEKDMLINKLSKLNSSLYKYAIKGNKDSNDSIEILKSSNFIYLDNNFEYLFNNDNEPIVIIGGDNLDASILPNDENISYNFIITLIHKPDYFDNIGSINSSLVLAGHCLGGQIRIPFWGALIKDDGAKKYSDDTYESKLYISYGLGLGNTKLRLFNTPSINVYRLYNK